MPKIVRTARIQFNAGRKPVSKISDRAKRYRANQDVPPGPDLCGYCGSPHNLGVDHIDGNESHGDPGNLIRACKRCNTYKANLMRRAGLGRKTSQTNSAKKRGGGRADMEAYKAAIKVMRGEWDGDVSEAVRTIRATPPAVRSRFTSRTWGARKAIYGPSGRSQGKLFDDEVPF